MDNSTGYKISAIISNEHELELIISDLIAQTVGRHDISVQGTPTQLADKYGVPYIAPEVIQDSSNPPQKESFMQDDFAWVLGFSFSIPLVICIIIGIFLIGDIRSTADNIIYGILGAIIGSFIGYVIANAVKNHHERAINLQEKRGGFVLWVTYKTQDQEHEIIAILHKHNALEIKVG